MRKIPSYALYGEAATPAWRDLLHVEWIRERNPAFRGEIRPHCHDTLLQLIYMREGRGVVNVESQRIEFAAPCLLLLPSRTVHAFSFASGSDGPVISAVQRPLESMMRIAAPELLGLFHRPAVLPLPWAEDSTLWPLFVQLESEVRGEESGQFGAGMALLLALLVRVARLARPARAQRPRKERRAALLERFRELVNRQFRQHWSLELYASHLGISTAQLGRLCREELGESALGLINARLMREAQRQLAYSGLDVKQIARDLGFRDTSYFSRFFRKQAGVKPSEFRAACRRAADGAPATC